MFEIMGAVYGALGMALLLLWLVGRCWQTVRWVATKLFEGFVQIGRGLDWIPGWVYVVLIAALMVADLSGVLPVGLRDIVTWIDEPSISEAPTETFTKRDAMSAKAADVSVSGQDDKSQKQQSAAIATTSETKVRIQRPLGQSDAMTADVQLKRRAAPGTRASTFEKDGKHEKKGNSNERRS